MNRTTEHRMVTGGFSAAQMNRRVGRKPLKYHEDGVPTAAEVDAGYRRAKSRIHIPKLETTHNVVSARSLNAKDFRP